MSQRRAGQARSSSSSGLLNAKNAILIMNIHRQAAGRQSTRRKMRLRERDDHVHVCRDDTELHAHILVIVLAHATAYVHACRGDRELHTHTLVIALTHATVHGHVCAPGHNVSATDNTSGQATRSVEKTIENPCGKATQSVEEDITLDEETLLVIGKRLRSDKKLAEPVHKDIQIRWEEIYKDGLPKDIKAELLSKHPQPVNIAFLEAPKLNIELKKNHYQTRDKKLEGPASADEQEIHTNTATTEKVVGRALQATPVFSPQVLLNESQVAQEAELEEVSSLAGRLKFFTENWRSITSDEFILNTIKGFKIPFKSEIRQQQQPCELSWSNKEIKDITEQIDKLLQKGAIRKCDAEDDQFISRIFLTPKPDGSNRLILNLKPLNEFIDTSHFKMEDSRTAQRLMYRDCYMVTIDLKDAYYLVPIASEHRKYLRFSFQGQIFEFTVLPFGLNCAQLIFTKIMKPTVTFLRKKGLMSVIYLDDILLFGHSVTNCLDNANQTIELLEKLGFVINYEKSRLSPSKKCIFLGLCLNSEKMQVELPPDKRLSVLKLIRKYQKTKRCKIRDFASFIGSLGFCCQAATYGWAYLKNFEREKVRALEKNHGNYEFVIEINPELQADFKWWKNNILKIVKPIRNSKFSLEIFSDSSLTGWGAYCKEEKIHGFWSQEERRLHINCLELLAAFFALKSFAKNLSDCNLLLRIDNTTAISYINHMGGMGSKKLSEVAKKIWLWCERRNIWLFASYIQSKSNGEADFESRRLEPETEYALSEQAFRRIRKRTPSTVATVVVASGDFIKKALARRGISDRAATIALASVSKSTLKQYECPIKKWRQFCVREKLDPLLINFTALQDFLAEEFFNGASYTTINCYRSAMSFVFGPNVAEDPGIKRICKGAYKIRPQKPKYNSTWDPKVVLERLAKWTPNNDISLKQLSSKLATLLALVTGHRIQTLSLININDINVSNDRIEIKIPAQIKTSGPKRKQPVLILPFFDKKEICAAQTLLDYLKVTQEIRGETEILFISFKKPHKAVGTQTLSKWIKKVLKESGIDTDCFGAYSTRHASTSAAKRVGVNIDTIRATAGWTNESKTFTRFYDLNIVQDKTEFAKAILNL
ncbi:uncharacterized protein [Venturia canescens]|uniref:uncharacterized protein n=1 Tax=Venturia canescens TaxID=32260 RepID=UPI001C9BC682|nr:uncharacterized protein LOC122407996 [Venturia canescens]